ncbi:MAG: hypothetical protein JWQ76_2443 [Ramlibacter sp.]|nr:hypothetical protein [Ramlibacter sp.]
MTTIESNVWGCGSGHTYTDTFRPLPDGTTKLDAVIVREGKNINCWGSCKGREAMPAIFAQSSATRGSASYTTEPKIDEHTVFLRWEGTMDGHKIESLKVIVGNEQGLMVERTIALRPYPAVKLFRDAMYASLKDKLPPDVWEYPTP